MEGNGIKTKEEEGNPARWRLSLTDPGSVGAAQTVAPRPRLMPVVAHEGPFLFIYLISMEAQTSKQNNEWREIDVPLSQLKISY